MKYCSTRGKIKGLSFEDVLFSGFLADGGMALPESIPQVCIFIFNLIHISQSEASVCVSVCVNLFMYELLLNYWTD